jgi:hypothetical protein
MHDHIRQDPDTNERIIQWIQQLESQTPMTAQTEENPIPLAGTAGTASQSPLQTPILQSLPVDNVVVLMETRMAYPNQRSGNHSPAGELGHPPTPMVLTIPLPQAEETEVTPFRLTIASAALSSQNGQVSHQLTGTRFHPHQAHHRGPSLVRAGIPTIVNRPEHATRYRPVQQIQWDLNAALRFHNCIQPVVKPVLSDMLPYPGHRWGAKDPDSSCGGELNIHFPCSMTPATDPPLTRMRLSRPFGGKLVVIPAVGNQFVSVGDVQKAVVAWMRWEQPHVRDDGLKFTRRENVRAQNGLTMSVEVWIWRGLTKSIGEADVWEINL